MEREDVCLHGGHIMQRVAQDVQILVRRRKDPPVSGADTIPTEKCLLGGDADDAAS